MYSYIKGSVSEINNTNIVLENNGIGYEIITPNPFKYAHNQEVLVYTYFHIREEIQQLYGFLTKAEKQLFITLLGVKGIGPKSACVMLASGSVDEITSAIGRSDVNYLKKYPGIGPKAAQQIILDLQGKLNFEDSINVSNYDDIVDALMALGYKSKDANNAVSKLEKGLDEAEALKLALKNLL